jgi:TldD protein
MLAKSIIEDVLSAALETGGDFSEIFVEDKINTSIMLVGGDIENSLTGRDYGVGIRIFKGLYSVYAYTNDSSRQNLVKVAREAAAAISGDREDIAIKLIKKEYENRHKIILMPDAVEMSRKAEILKRAYSAAKGYDECISQVRAGYIDSIQNVLIANSDGLLTEDSRVRSRISISSIATKGEEMQTGSYNPGAHMGFEFFDSIDVEEYARESARIAKTMLGAKPCPSGQMPVIVDNEFGGVIFHEACGHGLEATSVAKGTSVFANKIGQKVASDLVTAIDDGTIRNAWGSSNIDDEGNSTRRNVLIENGILKGYMIDKLNGRRMGMEATGSSRRQSYKFSPTSRMTNTYIAEGKSTLEEMIGGIERGIYAKYMGGGSVNPATGDFNFSVMEGYLVENGEIKEPVKGATLIGNGPNVLMKIDMVGNNLAHGQGMCGSISGSIPANVGQPAIRIRDITVGGTKK